MPISETWEHLTPKITARIKRVSIKGSGLFDLILKSQTRIIPLFSPSSRESKLQLFHNKTSNNFKDLYTTTTGEHTNHPWGETGTWSEKISYFKHRLRGEKHRGSCIHCIPAEEILWCQQCSCELCDFLLTSSALATLVWGLVGTKNFFSDKRCTVGVVFFLVLRLNCSPVQNLQF